ncbi:MAG: hypothetical protein QOE28_866 [Solirubrobacteraceae bacterium]|nr:hypothetical protein [Solirubrobacteraceae bacterium]
MRPLLLATALLALAAPAAVADTIVATPADPTPVDAYGGRLAWSERDAATGRFRLMTEAGSGPVAVAVAERTGPFDVDLGPGPNGTAAVYSRSGTVYRYDFATGRETALGTGTLPAIWGSRIAFRRGPALYVRRLGSGARAVHGGTGAVTEIDLRGSRVAFVRRTGGPQSDRHTDTLLVGRAGGTARPVRRVAHGLLSFAAIRKPRLLAGALVYTIAHFGSGLNRFERYDLATHRTGSARGHQGLLSAAFDAGRFLYERTRSNESTCHETPSDGVRCTLALSGPVTFR